MYKLSFRVLTLAALASLAGAGSALAQVAPAPAADATPQAPAPAPPVDLPVFTTPCNNEYVPRAAPPDGSGPVALVMELCFEKQGGSPTIDPETYYYYINYEEQVSTPSAGDWKPYTDVTEQTIRDDFKRLWSQNFLEDLSIEAVDYRFPNGVIGKVVTFHMEERERVKVITYEGTKQLDRTKIEEQLRDRGIAIPADSLLDERKIRQVENVVREMMVEKGFSPDVTHEIKASSTGSKTVDIVFHVNEGRKLKIKDVEFVGNSEVSDGKLQRQLKDNKPTGLISFITGTGTYNAAKFEEDAERVVDYYQNRGYANVRVGQPELKVLENSTDGKTQWVELRIPVTEGAKYTFGELDFEGNKLARSDFLRLLYDVKPGEVYSRKKIQEGNRKAQEEYGRSGFMEFTVFPEITRSDAVIPPDAALEALVPEALRAPVDEADAKTAETAKTEKKDEELPHVDIVLRVTEGEQFFVNRIVFSGNTTTRDNVIRRELGTLVEGLPFNSAALKDSIRRLNQLGYFQELEGSEKDMTVEKVPDKKNQVDVTLKLQEQNRNQLTFGAGISQYEGFFGQLAFQTSNFLGRGESLTVSLQGGERAQNYQLGFTEPFLFDRNITGGIDIHKRALQYIGYYTQKSTGGNLTFGFPVAPWTRMFMNYSYEEVGISDLNEALLDTSCILANSCTTLNGDLSGLTDEQIARISSNPFLNDSLLLAQGGKRTISKLVPTLLYNTVNSPLFPTAGRKLTASVDLALLGGNTQFYKPRVEGIWYIPHTSRTSLGLRGLFEYIAPLRNTDSESLPIFERLFLGGEYSVRGYDIRSIGPTLENSQVVLGGNKSLLFNAEYMFTIANPVRLVLFYDAGQVRDFGQGFAWKEDLTRLVAPPPPLLVGQFGDIVRDPNAPPNVTTEIIGRTSAWKTSTGLEVRFFMPVLNVPFRLIYAFNPQRGGVLDNDLTAAPKSTFKFSVGTTF
jgi:outer membrane protein insertion porin family